MTQAVYPELLSKEFNTSTWTLDDWKDHVEWLERQDVVEAHRLSIMNRMRSTTITTDRE